LIFAAKEKQHYLLMAVGVMANGELFYIAISAMGYKNLIQEAQ
jgi:hypothetical protein